MNTPDILAEMKKRLGSLNDEAAKLRAAIAAIEGTPLAAPAPTFVPVPYPVPAPQPATFPFTPRIDGPIWVGTPLGWTTVCQIDCGTWVARS